ncbi:MAG: HNH endonuclease [Bdellovibrionota bacterium]
MAATVLDTRVLVLNRSYLPVNVVSVRRAFSLLYQGDAKVLDDEHQLFDFDSWAQLSVAAHQERVGLVNRAIRVPRVILLGAYDRLPHRHVKFNRLNIFARDRNRCQYCGKRFARSDLNIDHVVPKTQGGTTCWENVVCSCIRCNRLKGGRTPVEASMRLIRKPFRPNWTPVLLMPGKPTLYRQWEPFLVNAAYWNTELIDE